MKPFISNRELKKETSVITTLSTVKPLFSVANLWNIHKTYATGYNRRRSLAL